MHRIDDTNAVSVRPTPTDPGTPGYFFAGDPLTGQPGTAVTADWLNDVQEAVVDPILSAGLTLVKGNTTQLKQAIRLHAADVLKPYTDAIDVIIAAVGITRDIGNANQLRQAILLDTHRVGDVVIRADNTSPATLYGGTWVNYAAGRVLVGLDASDSDFSTVGNTGGAKTHTLTTAEMPAHNHGNGDHTYLLKPPYEGSLTGSDSVFTAGLLEQAVGPGDGAAIQSAGGGSAHNNMPPYVVVRFWQRTA